MLTPDAVRLGDIYVVTDTIGYVAALFRVGPHGSAVECASDAHLFARRLRDFHDVVRPLVAPPASPSDPTHSEREAA
jgi:hypothetical protein